MDKCDKGCLKAVYRAAHDMRAPVRHIRHYIQRGQVDKATEVIGRLEAMLTRLVGEAKAGSLPIKKTPCDLARLTSDAILENQTDLEKAGAKLQLDLSPVVIECDRMLMMRVLDNLLGNCIQHVAFPTIAIRTFERDKFGVLTVKDDGHGAESPADILSGPGMGVDIVSRIVQAHGGTMQIDTGRGRGAEFTIAIPRQHRTH